MTADNRHCLKNKRVLLGVTGSIAAYKAAELLRRLQDSGADVRVVMTKGATEFITPLTMQALSGYPVATSLLDTEAESAMGHIELARWSDIILVAPATADMISRLAHGRGDDLLSTLCLAAECPIAIAPAMNQAMWQKPVTQANCELLRNRGVRVFEPGEGTQACGDSGPGRLMEVNDLVNATADVFISGAMTGMTVVITAGPTREALDPVRYITNHSSGKQGYALAAAARDAGANVVLVSGPVELDPLEGVKTVPVITAQDMYAAVMAEVDHCDLFIGVAAVADYRPEVAADQKIKKTDDTDTLNLQLVKNPDILASVALLEKKPYTVGFAAETEALEAHARKKLIAKKLDMIIANDVSDSRIGFHSEDNSTLVLYGCSDEVVHLNRMSKSAIAEKVLNLVMVGLKLKEASA